MADAAQRKLAERERKRDNKRAERERKKEQGLVRLELWLPPALHDRVRKSAALILTRESKKPRRG